VNLRILLAIAAKDVLAAGRDGRMLVALLMPLGLGVLYNVITPDVKKPTVTVAVASAGETQLPALLQQAGGSTVTVKLQSAADVAAVRSLVNNQKADVGLVVPAGFDSAVSAGEAPALTLVRPGGTAGFGASYVTASLDAVLRQMAGQHPPATVEVQTTSPAAGDLGSLVAKLGVRRYLVLGTLLMLVAMIAFYVLPVLLTEEYEKKTAEALLLIASQADIVVGKALVGFAYVAVSVPIFLLVTRMSLSSPLLFMAAILSLTAALVAFGLLIGGLARTVAQLNTWSSFPLLVLIMPAFLGLIGLPAWAQFLLDATPGTQVMKMLVDSASAEPVYGTWPIPLAVVLGWGVVGYALLIRSLRAREA
jgi:ABC-2 type transport system permease protein